MCEYLWPDQWYSWIAHFFFLKPIQLLFYIIEFRQFCLTEVRTGEGSRQNAEGILEFCCE